ncbi:MAG: hypothetical protein GQ581_02865 [Methyloprofundus sp.]|nr:hypothetical protein [Methyloprofundus sp.]
MMIFARRVIIMLLLLLQGFSPLVHAHVQSVDDVSGVHMHLYQLNADADTVSAITSADIVGHSGMQDNLHSSIELPNLLDMEHGWPCFVMSKIACLQISIVDKYVTFSPHIDTIKPALIVSISAPRAPPL